MLKLLLKKIIGLFTVIWVIIAAIPLMLGIFMIDILISMLGVEKNMLLGANLSTWLETISVYLKLSKQKENLEKKENV